MPFCRRNKRKKYSLGGIIQKPGTNHKSHQHPHTNRPDYTPPPPHSSPTIAYEERRKKMNSLRAVSRAALRAKPIRSLFVATRTYADAAGPADKIRLSLALPHQVRGHSVVELEMMGFLRRAIADMEGRGRLSTKLRMCTFRGPSSSSSSCSPHFISKRWGVYKTTKRGKHKKEHLPPRKKADRIQTRRTDGSEN